MGLFGKHGIGGILKKVASVALPIAGSYLGGPIGGALGGALGGEVAGGGLKGALIGGALGGLGGTLSGAQGTLTDGTWMGDLNNSWLNSGLGSSISGVGTDIGNFFNGAPATSSGASAVSPVFNANGATASGGLGGISTSAGSPFNTLGSTQALSVSPSALASATAPTKTVFGGLTNALEKDPFGALAAGASIYSNVDQQQKQADLLKDQAAQNQAYNNQMIAALNTPVTPRVQMPVDLANYGHSGTGEGTFFNDPIQKYAKGGMVQGPPMVNTQPPAMPQSPLSGMVSGAGGGQDDQVPIMAADGEHVVPADVVSMLGDGSSKQGSNKLRKLEQNVRKAKGVKNVKTIPKKIKANLKAYTE